MAKLFANSAKPDQTLRFAASDLGLHCLPNTLLRVSRLQWAKKGPFPTEGVSGFFFFFFITVFFFFFFLQNSLYLL